MEKIVISLVNIVGDAFCVEAEEGIKVFQLIKKAFEDKKKVEISFLNVEMLTTAFLNTAIGQLYKDFTEEDIKQNLSVSEISKSGKISLKRVVETAKLYYKDPAAMENSINEILED